MRNNYIATPESELYSATVNAMRSFFLSKGYTEVHTQDRLSILAACEDPTTVATYNYNGAVWPLPQTGQMWLEYELLSNPDLKGVFTVSTSYRDEPDPTPGRHDLIFPMFEFEQKGEFDELREFEKEFCEYLGFGNAADIPSKDYLEMAKHYGVKELESEHEMKMEEEFGKAVLLEKFPQYTSPFWNMKKDADSSYKIDVIVGGMESIGSAARATDRDEMRDMFHSISDGLYAKLLYNRFSKERVEKELDEYLSFDFFPRFGAGIGIGRFMKAYKKYGMTPPEVTMSKK